MRMLIASDLHGSCESLEFLLAKTEEMKPDHVVLLGDILYHGPRNRLPASYGPGNMPDNFREPSFCAGTPMCQGQKRWTGTISGIRVP